MDKEYDRRIKEKGRGSDAKKREAKQINDAFGKRGTKQREEKSKDLHDEKARAGVRNDDNKDWEDLTNDFTNLNPFAQFQNPSVPIQDSSNSTTINTNGGTNVTSKQVTTAVVLYWIISEGSRLFPPRNLIPIP